MPNTTAMMRGGGMTDGLAALADANRAKIVTGGRNPLLAAIELGVASAKFWMRPFRRPLERIAIK